MKAKASELLSKCWNCFCGVKELLFALAIISFTLALIFTSKPNPISLEDSSLRCSTLISNRTRIQTKLVYTVYVHSHESVDWSLRLVARLNNSVDFTIVHVDANAGAAVLEYAKTKLSSFSRTAVVSLSGLAYEDISQVLASLRVVEWALDNLEGWSHVIQLSGDTYPIATFDKIHETFNSSFGYSFSATRTLWPEGNARLLRCKHFNPPPVNSILITHGPSWWALYYDHARMLIGSSFARDLLLYFSCGISADEAFFQTFLTHLNLPIKTEPCLMWTKWHSDDSHALEVTDSLLENVFSTNCLFARKVRTMEIANEIDKHIGNDVLTL